MLQEKSYLVFYRREDQPLEELLTRDRRSKLFNRGRPLLVTLPYPDQETSKVIELTPLEERQLQVMGLHYLKQARKGARYGTGAVLRQHRKLMSEFVLTPTIALDKTREEKWLISVMENVMDEKPVFKPLKLTGFNIKKRDETPEFPSLHEISFKYCSRFEVTQISLRGIKDNSVIPSFPSAHARRRGLKKGAIAVRNKNFPGPTLEAFDRKRKPRMTVKDLRYNA